MKENKRRAGFVLRNRKIASTLERYLCIAYYIVNLLIILRYSLLYLQLYLKTNVLFSVINCVIVELVK